MYLVETHRPEPIPVDDLKIVVRKGEPTWITWAERCTSTCLHRLVAIGHLKVSQGERSREEKKPSRKPIPSRARPERVASRPPPPAPEATYTKAEVDRLVSTAATKAAQQASASILSQLQALLPGVPTPAPPSLEGLEGRVEAAVAKALSNENFAAPAGSSGPAKRVASGPEEPLFIPTGIVPDVETDLNLQSESAEDVGLEDVAAQLKKLRQKKRET